jgi:hypothetical protein
VLGGIPTVIWPTNRIGAGSPGQLNPVDIDGELARLGTDGYRRLRLPTTPAERD